MKYDKVYWVAKRRSDGKLMGSHRVRTPRLYLGKKAAMAAHRGYMETDEQLLEYLDFIPVNIVEVTIES